MCAETVTDPPIPVGVPISIISGSTSSFIVQSFNNLSGWTQHGTKSDIGLTTGLSGFGIDEDGSAATAIERDQAAPFVHAVGRHVEGINLGTMTGNGDLGDGSYQNLHLDDFGTAAPSRVQFTMAGLFDAISFDLTPIGFDFFRMDNAGGIDYSTYKNVLVQGYQGTTVVSSMLFNMGSAFNTYTVSLGDGFKNLTSLAIEVFLPQRPFAPVGTRVRLVDLDVKQFLDESGVAHLRGVSEQAGSDLGVENRRGHRAGRLVDDLDILPGRMQNQLHNTMAQRSGLTSHGSNLVRIHLSRPL